MSLQDHIEALREKHAELERAIDEEISVLCQTKTRFPI